MIGNRHLLASRTFEPIPKSAAETVFPQELAQVPISVDAESKLSVHKPIGLLCT